MKKPLFIFSADWHLTARPWKDHPEIAGDAARSLRQIGEYCVSYQVPLLAGGDLFDQKQPDSESVQAAMRLCDKLAAAGLALYYVQGQHDMSDPPWLSLHALPIHLHNRTVVLGEHAIHGLDYTPAVNVETALKAVPTEATVLLTHQVWKEFMGESRGYSRADMMARPRLVLTGDYHVTEEKMAAGSTLVSPGSTYLNRINQPVDKYVLLFYSDLSYERLPLETRQLVRIHVSTTREEIEAAVCEAFIEGDDGAVPPLVRLVWSGESERNAHELTVWLRSQRVAVFDEQLQPMPDIALPKLGVVSCETFDFEQAVRQAAARLGASESQVSVLLSLLQAPEANKAVADFKLRLKQREQLA